MKGGFWIAEGETFPVHFRAFSFFTQEFFSRGVPSRSHLRGLIQCASVLMQGCSAYRTRLAIWENVFISQYFLYIQRVFRIMRSIYVEKKINCIFPAFGGSRRGLF